MPRSNRTMRARATNVGLALALAMAPAQVAGVSGLEGTIEGDRHWTGLELVGPEVMQISPKDEAQAGAISAAIQFAMDHPHDTSYPWVDESREVIQLSATSDAGMNLLTPLAAAQPTEHAVRKVERSLAEMEQLAYEVSRVRGSGMAGEEVIFRTEPDWKNNRIILVVSDVHDGLFKFLADTFGTEALAVRVDPDVRPAHADDSRQADVNPFTGGARLWTSGCTDAFSWVNGSLWEGMLTAAHCHPANGQTRQDHAGHDDGRGYLQQLATRRGDCPLSRVKRAARGRGID
jgi:hypothetical protein